jgi:hypothetical protein
MLAAALVGYLFEACCLHCEIPIAAALFVVLLYAVFAVTTLIWPSDWRDLFSTIAYPVAWKTIVHDGKEFAVVTALEATV